MEQPNMKPQHIILAAFLLTTPLASAATGTFILPSGYTLEEVYPSDASTTTQPFNGLTLVEITRQGDGSIALTATNGTAQLALAHYAQAPTNVAAIHQAINDSQAKTLASQAEDAKALHAALNQTSDFLYDHLVRLTGEAKDQATKEGTLTRSRIPADPWPATKDRLEQLSHELKPTDPGLPWITWFMLLVGFGAVIVLQLPQRFKPQAQEAAPEEDEGILLDLDE